MSSAEPGSDLARARCRAHAAFDPIWKSGEMSRSAAYRWLAQQLGIPEAQCHMIQFDIETCDRVTDLCNLRAFDDLTK